MKGLKMARKLHLWIGLILSIVLLVEAITGLMLAEPKLFSQQAGPPFSSAVQAQVNDQTKPQETGRPSRENRAQPPGTPSGISAKGLHKGMVGSVNLGWLVDLSAVGLIILVLTGVYMAIPQLRARTRK